MEAQARRDEGAGTHARGVSALTAPGECRDSSDDAYLDRGTGRASGQLVEALARDVAGSRLGSWIPLVELRPDVLLARRDGADELALLEIMRDAARDLEVRDRLLLQDSLARGSGGLIARVVDLVAEGPHLIAAIEPDGQLLSSLALPLDPGEVARIGRDLAAALARLHDHGRVHGALWSGSTLTGGQHRHAALLDLGLAAPIGQLAAPTAHVRSTSLAPENFSGHPVDPRTDVWGLGALCFTLATGHAWHPRCGGLLGAIDPRLAPVIGRCLVDRPDRRYQSTAEVAAALDPVASTPLVLFELFEPEIVWTEETEQTGEPEPEATEAAPVVEEHEFLDEATAFGEHADWFIDDDQPLTEDQVISLYGYKQPLSRAWQLSLLVAMTGATFASIAGLAQLWVEGYGR